MEIEIRAKIKDQKIIRRKLNALNAKCLDSRTEKDTYFSSIELCKKMGYSFVIRIREIRNPKKDYILTIKTAKKKMDGIWEEYETKIENPRALIFILKSIGMEEVITVAKKRECFQLGHIAINLDNFKKWGKFIELEIISSDKSAKKTLPRLFMGLGLEKKDIIEKGYISLFLKKMRSPFAEYIKN